VFTHRLGIAEIMILLHQPIKDRFGLGTTYLGNP